MDGGRQLADVVLGDSVGRFGVIVGDPVG